MPQPNVTIQDSYSAQNQAKLFFNRNQYCMFRFFGTTTTNATDQELFIDGISGNRLVLPEDCTVTFHALCAGYPTTAAEAVGASITGAVRRTGSDSFVVGTNVADVFSDGTPTFTYAVVPDDVNDSLRVNVATATNETVYHEVILMVAVATSPESNFGSLT